MVTVALCSKEELLNKARVELASATKREESGRALRRTLPRMRIGSEASLLRTAPARSAVLVSLALLTALLSVGCSSAFVPPTGTKEVSGRPNMIFVLADDLDYASAQKMPQIDSLLREGGTSFEEAFVSHPVCCPSRATALTGLYDHNHNVRGNSPPDGVLLVSL